MFFNLASQLPLITIRNPEDLVTKNKVTLMVGFLCYMAIGLAIYFKKVPEKIMSMLPDNKYLLVVVIVDLILYFVIHRFQYGMMPVFSTSSLPAIMYAEDGEENLYRDNEERPKLKSKLEDGEDEADLNDDLESTYKKPGQIRQTNNNPMPLEDEISEFSSVVQEASVAGKDYFKNDEDNKAVVENWDIDEYTHEEFVPDRSKKIKSGGNDISMDEVVIE